MSANPYDEKYRLWYGADAAKYDRRFTTSFTELEAQFIVDLIEPRDGMRILDVGTGTGRGSIPLAAAANTQVIGLDITPEMMTYASGKRDELGLSFPAFVCANGRALPFADNTFDAVLSIRVLHLFPTPYLGGFVEEMKRVLKPGGTLLVEFNSPFTALGWIPVREVQRRLEGRKPRHYLWPQHVDSLFGDMEHAEVFGFWLPGLGKLARANPRLRGALRLARLNPPFGYLGDKLLIRSRKPTQEAATRS